MKIHFLIIIIIIIFIIFLGGFFTWREIYSPKDIRVTEEKIFSVEKNQGFFQIAENLEKEGLIKNRFLFNFYVLSKGAHRGLQVGDYFLSPSMDISQITKRIVSGDTAKMVVTIPEGFTVRQIEERMGLKLPGENLEGFLFPDTYQFPIRVNGEEAVKEMRENFEKKLTPELREEIEKQGKSIFEIITMASLLEKEVRSFEDKKMVSGILWKRLETGMPLQVDATIAYILGERDWTFQEMLIEIGKARKIDSPYNTYKYRGLPPGPICNPGLKSIMAAIYPIENDYWFYLSKPEGETVFSRTLREHNSAKARYFK